MTDQEAGLPFQGLSKWNGPLRRRRVAFATNTDPRERRGGRGWIERSAVAWQRRSLALSGLRVGQVIGGKVIAEHQGLDERETRRPSAVAATYSGCGYLAPSVARLRNRRYQMQASLIGLIKSKTQPAPPGGERRVAWCRILASCGGLALSKPAFLSPTVGRTARELSFGANHPDRRLVSVHKPSNGSQGQSCLRVEHAQDKAR
jgi:hypothetical protein